MKLRAPRLIHCVLPSYHTDQQTILMRVITTQRLVSVLSHAPIEKNLPQNLLIDTGPYGRSWVSDAPIPDILQTVFEKPYMRKKALNENRINVTNEVEFSLSWSGNVSHQIIEPLHKFVSHYAYRHSGITKTKDQKNFQTAYLLTPDQVVGFQRVVARLSARRPWLKVKMMGPWPPFSFPEIWPKEIRDSAQ